jgi:hypothetical protein
MQRDRWMRILFYAPLRIPTGFRNKAQGCEARATLGYQTTEPLNPKGVAPVRVRMLHMIRFKSRI